MCEVSSAPFWKSHTRAAVWLPSLCAYKENCKRKKVIAKNPSKIDLFLPSITVFYKEYQGSFLHQRLHFLQWVISSETSMCSAVLTRNSWSRLYAATLISISLFPPSTWRLLTLYLLHFLNIKPFRMCVMISLIDFCWIEWTLEEILGFSGVSPKKVLWAVFPGGFLRI